MTPSMGVKLLGHEAHYPVPSITDIKLVEFYLIPSIHLHGIVFILVFSPTLTTGVKPPSSNLNWKILKMLSLATIFTHSPSIEPFLQFIALEGHSMS
jgi:hypothetical protein